MRRILGGPSEALQLEQEPLPVFTSQPPSPSPSKNRARPRRVGGVSCSIPPHLLQPQEWLPSILAFPIQTSFSLPQLAGDDREEKAGAFFLVQSIQSPKPVRNSHSPCPSFLLSPSYFINPTHGHIEKEYNVGITHPRSKPRLPIQI